MKKLFTLLLLFMFCTTIGYSNESSKEREKAFSLDLDLNEIDIQNLDHLAIFACCDSYVTDAVSGESFVAVRYCKGDQSVESYILACIQADAIRDRLLAQ